MDATDGADAVAVGVGLAGATDMEVRAGDFEGGVVVWAEAVVRTGVGDGVGFT